ncbi:hypothetical protein [Geminisphaera colitermitum]|uniref:hypothetical protein n=1 Tax=Geminisphaera colitermitum TaxID=1148786 RepID=UPI000158D0F2|nr:hypothetical protein [Geminisphaera colitermitum]
MVRQSDASKLLAIGLLNYADDEGYFYADARLIRAALRPLDEDSSNVRRALDDLSKIGFVELREHSSHGPTGRIVSFAEHQRVDRPSKSKIKPFFDGAAPSDSPPEKEDSSNVRRALDERSSLERKGKEQGKEGNGDRASASAAAPIAETPGNELPLPQSEPPPAAPKPRQRDPLFDALAAVDGSDPAQLTKPAARAVGVALADIRRVVPGLTPDEIARRAANYRLHMPDVTLSASALAKWWAKCANPPPPPTHRPGGNPFQMPLSDHSKGF